MTRKNRVQPVNSAPVVATAAHRLAERIRQDIVDGHFTSGQRLLEKELTERYSVSRIPLREAFRILAGQGLVQFKPYRGTFVSEMSVEDIVDIAEVRVALESAALRLALPRLTPQVLDEAEQLARELDHCFGSGRCHELHWQFFSLLYEVTHRPRLLHLLRSCIVEQQRYLTLHTQLLQAYHPPIPTLSDFVAVLKQGNVEAAVRFQAERLWAHTQFFIRHLGEYGPNGLAGEGT